jgi:membrane protein DedA with SNARE-associated domain
MGWFETFTQEYATYGYPVLFIGVLLENAGLPVPGETAVLLAGFLASPSGGGHFNLWLVILFTLIAAVIGDNAGYWLGYRFARPRLQRGRAFLFLTPKTLQLAEGYFVRYGTWTIFFARFITGLRVVGALAAGTAGMHWPRFFAANASGALAWAITMSLLGYFFGQSLDLLHQYLGRGGLIILSCVIVLVGLPYLLHRLRQRAPGLWQRVFGTQIWLGILAAVLEVACIALLVVLAEHPAEHEAGPGQRLEQRIEEWLGPARNAVPLVSAVAERGLYIGALPLALAVSALMIPHLWYRGRPWREIVAMLWALVASEGVGLVLLALLRHKGVAISWTAAWPYGFAGLAPLRAFAVFGMAAYLLSLQWPARRGLTRTLAVVLVLFVGASAVWTHQQTFTQVLLEWAAGGLVLFAGLWWLEGHIGLAPLPPEQPPPADQR